MNLIFIFKNTKFSSLVFLLFWSLESVCSLCIRYINLYFFLHKNIYPGYKAISFHIGFLDIYQESSGEGFKFFLQLNEQTVLLYIVIKTLIFIFRLKVKKELFQ